MAYLGISPEDTLLSALKFEYLTEDRLPLLTGNVPRQAYRD
jgi:hypothetical protein